jgi:hypothetical protein
VGLWADSSAFFTIAQFHWRLGEWSVVEGGRIFLLSPANAGGKRFSFLMRDGASFDGAMKLRQGVATIGEVYSFVSGLYFRGKMAYAEAFAAAPAGMPAALVILPGRGLVAPETRVSMEELRAIAAVEVDEANLMFRDALCEAAQQLDEHGGGCSYVLLGSVASAKYTEPLLEVFGERLLFPIEFVGRGDMSRGGLMLHCADAKTELAYVPVQGTKLRGARPAKLEALRRHHLSFRETAHGKEES